MTEEQVTVPGLKHWLFQAVPPAIMLIPLLVSRDGTGFVFLAGIFFIPALISIVSILIKLFSFRKKKYYFLRPVLTILFLALLVIVAGWSKSIALAQAVSVAESILEQCNNSSGCPDKPEGWHADGHWIMTKLGNRYQYHASYSPNENGFEISLYYGPDYSDVVIGNIASQRITIKPVGN